MTRSQNERLSSFHLSVVALLSKAMPLPRAWSAGRARVTAGAQKSVKRRDFAYC